MKQPEWEKEHEEHEDTENIHRAIFISTASPKSTDGEDGDIWIVYK